MKITKIALSVYFVFILTASSIAQTFYVDATNGNDNNNGTTISTPWKTLQKVNSSWSLFGPGDSVLFKRGETWAPSSGGGSEALLQPNVNLTGNTTSYIVFGAYGTGNRPIISCANQSNKYAVYTISSRLQYVIIQDIEFRGSLELWAYSGDMHHVKVLRCYIDGTGAPNGSIYFFRNPSNEPAPEVWTFEGNSTIRDIEIGYCTIIQADYDGMFISANGNVWVHHNEVYDCGEDGIDLQGSNNIMEYNVVSGTTATGIKNMPHYGGGANNIIRGNLVVSSGNAAGINLPNARNTKVYNNTVAYTGFGAIFGWQELNPLAYTTGGTTGFDNNQIFNNIFIGAVYMYTAKSYNFTYKNGSTLTGYHQDSLWVSNLWQHNIYYNGSPDLYFRYFTGSATWSGPNTINYSYNSSFTTNSVTSSNWSYWTSKPNVTNDRSINPQFTSNTWNSSMRKAQLLSNFSLQESSPGRSSGVIIPEYMFDINGTPIPLGVSPDVGAIQHSTGGSGGTPTANIKIFLEAPFIGGSMNTALRTAGYVPLNQPYNTAPWNYSGTESVASIPAGVVDWVLLEFRTSTSYSSVATRRAAFLKSNGTITDLDGSSTITLNGLPAGYYYIVVKHRNHLPVMSANLVALTETSTLYDFSNSLSKAYGSNSMISLGSGVYGLYSGDGDFNGSINVIDYGTVGNNLFQTGYRVGDINMDGTINVLDYTKIGSNLFKSSQVPN